MLLLATANNPPLARVVTARQTLPYGPNPKGTMMVDANGRFSIMVIRSDLPKFISNNRMSGTLEENKSVVQGSIAYYGTYSIDEATHVLTVNVEGSTFPNFTGGSRPPLRRSDIFQSHAVYGRQCKGNVPSREITPTFLGTKSRQALQHRTTSPTAGVPESSSI